MNMKMVVKIVGAVLIVLFFVLPVIQCTQDSSINATSFQIATQSGNLMENADDAYPVVFVLLLIPIVLIIMAFITKSFSVLRIISIIGFLAKCAFIVAVFIMLNDSDGAFELTPFVWITVALYAGLIGFTQYCISKNLE